MAEADREEWEMLYWGLQRPMGSRDPVPGWEVLLFLQQPVSSGAVAQHSSLIAMSVLNTQYGF